MGVAASAACCAVEGACCFCSSLTCCVRICGCCCGGGGNEGGKRGYPEDAGRIGSLILVSRELGRVVVFGSARGRAGVVSRQNLCALPGTRPGPSHPNPPPPVPSSPRTSSLRSTSAVFSSRGCVTPRPPRRPPAPLPSRLPSRSSPFPRTPAPPCWRGPCRLRPVATALAAAAVARARAGARRGLPRSWTRRKQIGVSRIAPTSSKRSSPLRAVVEVARRRSAQWWPWW